MKYKISIIIVFLLLFSIFTYAEEDTDKDGIPNSEDPYPFDFDNDGIPDLWEKKHGLKYDADDSKEDPDKDSLTNLEEYQMGTDPQISNLPEEVTYQKSFVEVLPADQFSPLDLLKRYLLYIILILLIAAIIVYRKELEKLYQQIKDKIKAKREAKKRAMQPQHPYYPRQIPPRRPIPPRMYVPPRPPLQRHSPVVRIIPSRPPTMAPKPIRPVQKAPVIKEEPIENNETTQKLDNAIDKLKKLI